MNATPPVEEIIYPEPPPDIAPGLGARLKAIRARLGCAQFEMHELLFIGKGSWIRYENERVLPGAGVLAAIAREGFNINWLLTGQGPMEIGRQINKKPDGAGTPPGL